MPMVQKTKIVLILIIFFEVYKGEDGFDVLFEDNNIADTIIEESLGSLQSEESLNSLESEGISLQQQQLDFLNNSLSQKVHEVMEPVRILQSIERIRQGRNGTTIATFNPHGEKFIVRDRIFYDCNNGEISDEDGNCSGTLKQYGFKKRQDFCYTASKTLINKKWYCLYLPGTGVTLSIANGKLSCRGAYPRLTLLIPMGEYESLCKKEAAKSIHYKYFTNDNIPEDSFGEGLECSGSEPQVCSFVTDFNQNSDVHITSSSWKVVHYEH